MTQTQPNYAKAITFCVLTCLAGGVIFGLIYGIGYYVYILPVAEVVCAVVVYQKFSKRQVLDMVASVLLSTILVWAFNVLSIITCEIIFVIKDLHLPFDTAYNLFFTLVKNDAGTHTAFVRTMTSASWITFFGAFIAIVYLLITKFAVKKQPKKQTVKTPTKQTVPDAEQQSAAEIYKNLYKELKLTISAYLNDNNSETFRQNIKSIKQKYIVLLDDETKNKILKNNDRLLAQNPDKVKTKTLQIMNKLLK